MPDGSPEVPRSRYRLPATMQDDEAAWADLFGADGTPTRDPAAAATFARLRGELFAAPTEPTRLGRLVVLERIGRGGMGVVYAAYDPELDRKVAVKVLHARSARAAERTLREGRALAKISHPNVVVVHDVEVVEERVHIVMEYVGGGTLRAWLRGPRTWGEIVGRFAEAGRGLEAVHDNGLVHGDFKPDNVLMGPDGRRARVADFGLATLAADFEFDGSTTTVTDATRGSTAPIGGTAGYAAPEQVRGEAIDARADQFAFCVSLYEALFGVRPFSPVAIAAGELGAPAAARPDMPSGPRALRQLLLRGLSAQRVDRFESIGGLVDRLEALVRPRLWRLRAPLAGAGGLAIGLVLAARSTGRDCEAAPAMLDQLWQDRRAAVLGAIAAVSRDAGAATDEKIDAALDAYVRQWSSTYRQTCTTTQGDTTGATAVRWQCLEQGRRRFDALTSVLTTVAQQELPQVVTAVADLEDPARCLSRATVLAPAPPPGHEADAARLRGVLARTIVAEELGRFDDALRDAQAVIDEAEQIEDAVLVADSMYQRAMAQEQLGRGVAARESQEAALWQAYRAGHHLIVAKAAIRLAYLRGYIDADQGEGTHWLRLAEEAVGIADPGGEAEAMLERVRAALALRRGKPGDARDALNRAMRILGETIGPRHYGVASAMQNLAVVQAMTGDDLGALAGLEEATGIFEEALGRGHPFTASVLKSKGEVLRRLGRFDEATATLRDAIDRLTVTLGGDHSLLADNWGVLGSALLQAGDIAGAEDATRRALAIQIASFPDGSVELAIEHNNLALVLQRLGRDGEAEHHMRESLAIKERLLGPADFQLAPTLTNIGELLERVGRADEAAPMFDRAVAILGAIEPIEPAETLSMRTRAAAFLRRRGEAVRARALLDLALTEADVAPARTIVAHLELARAWLDLGDPRAAASTLETVRLAVNDPMVPTAEREAFATVDADVRAALNR
jgi:tetratricopeptide (TPR) repeat protein